MSGLLSRTLRIVGRLLLVLLVIGVAVVIVLLPPAAQRPETRADLAAVATARGAFHIHSERSDGTGTIDEIAAAAARAGLQFIIVTDHGDGTRAPEPPSYRSGVLYIDAAEVSTTDGHVVALATPQMPFRLGGHPQDVLEDIHRAGGFGIAAHPGSPKPQLRWGRWDVPADGLEWLNADSEWRDEFWTSLGRVLMTYPFRPAETLASLLDRPQDVLAEWDRTAHQRHVTGIAGADAHARLSVRSSSEPYEDRVLARLPSYEASFRAFANHVILESPLTGDAASDAAAILDAVRSGRVYTSIEGLARLGGLEVIARGGGQSARLGEYIDAAEGVELTAKIAAPAGTKLVLLRDGQITHEQTGPTLTVKLGPEPAAYRLEAHLAEPGRHATVPWVVTNPVYVNLRAPHAARVRGAGAGEWRTRSPVLAEWWRTEASTDSQSVVAAGTPRADGTAPVQWQLRIGDDKSSPYAAIAFGSRPQFAPFVGIELRARASRPMRLSAQLRAAGEDRRWARSFYIGTDEQTIVLRFADFVPIGGADGSDRPPIDQIDSFLVVADTVNTLPRTEATVVLAGTWLAKN